MQENSKESCEQYHHSIHTHWQPEGLPEQGSGIYTATGVQHHSFPQWRAAPGHKKSKFSRQIYNTGWLRAIRDSVTPLWPKSEGRESQT